MEDLGPIDVVVIAYPADAPMTGDAVPLFMDLVERGIIRVLDVMFVRKSTEGRLEGFEAKDLDEKSVGSFVVFSGASSGLLGDEDIQEAGDALEPGDSAVVIVYENRWAAAFASAVRRNGGVFISAERIPVPALLSALEAAESADVTKGVAA